MKIYKNFLEEQALNSILSVIQSDQFSWYYNHVVNKEDLNPKATQNFQFTHLFYGKHTVQSDFFDLLTPVFLKIKPLSLIRIKANLIPKTAKIVEHGMHVDFESPHTKVTTGILYLNTNNGSTIFKNGKKIKSVKNQYIEFDSSLEHTGTTCTDQDRRMVINFNYVK